MADWAPPNDEGSGQLDTPHSVRSILHGVTEADLNRQAEADVEQGRLRGYVPVSRKTGESNGVLTMKIEYQYAPWTANSGGPAASASTYYQPAIVGRSKLVGGLLGIFLGTIGAHKFYNGKIAQGVLYLLFFWTLIPTLLGFVEGLWYLSMSDTDYATRYPSAPPGGAAPAGIAWASPPAARRGHALRNILTVAAVVVIGLVVIGSLAPPRSVPAGSIAPPAGHVPITLLDVRGNGIKSTQTFSVGGDWDLIYSFDCAGFGYPGNFIVTVKSPNGAFPDVAVNELSMKGADVTHLHAAGTWFLEMNSECSWHVTARG